MSIPIYVGEKNIKKRDKFRPIRKVFLMITSFHRRNAVFGLPVIAEIFLSLNMLMKKTSHRDF